MFTESGGRYGIRCEFMGACRPSLFAALPLPSVLSGSDLVVAWVAR